MTQKQAWQDMSREDAALSFKRHILEKTAGFENSPMADLYRVGLLSQMLLRYDALLAGGMSGTSGLSRVLHEYDALADMMREEGFEEADGQTAGRWPRLSEAEAEAYIRQSDAAVHRKSLGVALCTGCIIPMMISMGLSEVFYMAEEFFAIFGLIGMLVMIGLGVYAMVTAKKPEDEKRISQGRFSLSAKLRRKLEEMRTRVTGKSAKRRGRGIALLVTCLIPVLLSVGLADMFLTESLIFAGVVGMFAMIALGVYEIVTASGESKTMSKLLGGE